MSSFRRDEDGNLHIIFTSQEVHVLMNLIEQLLELLGESSVEAHHGDDMDPFMHLMGITGSDTPPDDPVLRRLFPNAYDDDRESAEFRRYTEYGLREKKRAHARQIYEHLAAHDDEWSADNPIERGSLEVIFPENEAMIWLGGLNDLRLALAVRLGIGDENSTSSDKKKLELMKDDDPMQAVYAVYSWIGWVQQSLLDLVMTFGDEHQAT